MCFPKKGVVKLHIPQTNKNLGKPMNLQEFYVWLGCVFFMSCFLGVENQDLRWSTKPIDMFDGALFCLNEFMSKVQINSIMVGICYTSKEAPLLFVDHFCKVCKMINAFNEH
jgi:hypothetical protein